MGAILQPMQQLAHLLSQSVEVGGEESEFIFGSDLRPHRQMIYDQQGNIVTDAKYDQFAVHDGIEFPNSIEIERPG